MHRLSEQHHGKWQPARGSGRFKLEPSGEAKRIVVSPSDRPLQLLLKLAPEIGSEFYVLWVLHTPRGGSQAGRYQSPLLSLAEVQSLLRRFSGFLESDGRHDLWLHAPATGATLVWDRHEQLFAYGPLEELKLALTREGLSAGEIEAPVPHAHNYHAEFDDAERAMVQALDWRIDELREEDEQ